MSAEHPDVVARLTQEIDAFAKDLSPASPVRISAAPYDHTGWEKLWRGVAMAGLVALGTTLVLLFAVFRSLRQLRRRG